jgi:phage terminase large subunit-like protein
MIYEIMRRRFEKKDPPWPASKEWLSGTSAKWNGDDYKWTFPSGATIEFGHMDHEDSKFNYQGAAYQFVGYDELTQFTESMYTYLFSRQRRRAESRVPIRMRSASNPGGIGHDWVKSRFIAAERNTERLFVPAKLQDNPNIDQAEYLASLSELDPITRGQLERGDWDAIAGGRFKREWFRSYTKQGDYVVMLHPDEGQKLFKPAERLRFITVDPAASEKQTADYTVISTWCVSPWQDLVWMDCVRVQKQIPDIVPIIQQAVLRWKPAYVAIEAVASNSAVLQLAHRASNPAINARGVSPLGQDKLVRATAAMNFAAVGRLYLPAANPLFPLDDVLAELVRFTGDDKRDANDDIVDTLSYAVACITGMPTKEDVRASAPRVYGGTG